MNDVFWVLGSITGVLYMYFAMTEQLLIGILVYVISGILLLKFGREEK